MKFLNILYATYFLVMKNLKDNVREKESGIVGRLYKGATSNCKRFSQPSNEVCEGNVFTGVCLSTGGSWSLSRGGLCPGCLCPGGLCPGRPPCMVNNGRYASYWNAFLLIIVLNQLSYKVILLLYNFDDVFIDIVHRHFSNCTEVFSTQLYFRCTQG